MNKTIFLISLCKKKSVFLGTLILILFISTNLSGQGKSKVKEKGIKNVKVFEQKFDKGPEDIYLSEETTYNNFGEIIEIIEKGRKGNIKRWEKFNYDSEGNCVEEIYLDETGDIQKQVVIIYSKGLKKSKEFYNSDGKLYRKKTYEYEYR